MQDQSKARVSSEVARRTPCSKRSVPRECGMRGAITSRRPAAAVAIGVALAKIVAPGKAGTGASARGVLPFGLCQKPIFLASQLREPADILLGVAPAHVDHRHLPASPAVCKPRACRRGDA